MRGGNFVEETTTSIAGTSGDGAVTLTAIASTPRFSTVLSAAAAMVRYVIEDTVGKQFESGIGSVAANVLTRTRPQITWTGTVYNDNAPTPLQFGATQATGNIKVRISPLTESSMNSQPGRQTLAVNDTTYGIYVPCNGKNLAGNPVARSFGANAEFYASYRLDTPGRITGVALENKLVVAGGLLKWSLYDVGANGLPNNQLIAFNQVTLDATGVKIDTAVGTWAPANGLWLPAGWYIIGFIANAAFQLAGSNPGSSATVYSRQGGYGVTDTLFKAGTFTTGLPAVPNLTGGTMGDPGSSANTGAWLGLKVVS